MDLKFRNQASLLLRLLPEIAKEKDFALHGGTAINFFYHDMPRLSVEVNTINRGVTNIPELRTLCYGAREFFDSFCEIQVVPFSQLFGGKICAALDRQHPRDIFDVKKMFENTGYTEKIHHGFLFCLLASKRPIHEILNPLPINQSQVLIGRKGKNIFDKFQKWFAGLEYRYFY